MTLSYPDGSKIQSDESHSQTPQGGLRCVPSKPSEESAKALSASNAQIPWATLERFPQTLATTVPLHTLTQNLCLQERFTAKWNIHSLLENKTNVQHDCYHQGTSYFKVHCNIESSYFAFKFHFKGVAQCTYQTTEFHFGEKGFMWFH